VKFDSVFFLREKQSQKYLIFVLVVVALIVKCCLDVYDVLSVCDVRVRNRNCMHYSLAFIAHLGMVDR